MKARTGALLLTAVSALVVFPQLNAQIAPDPAPADSPAAAPSPAGAGIIRPGTYNVSLTALPEVPPITADSSPSSGYALFNFYDDIKPPTYQIFVTNGIEITQGHIHQGLAGVSGPVVVWLYPVGQKKPATPPIGEVINGLLAEGTITTDAFVGPFIGKTIADLYEGVSKGGLYVNLHNKEDPQGFIRGDFQT